jgi:imidazole glycerol-phosphate synthase subunit HisH
VQRIALVDYGAGNLRSAERALVQAAANAGCACEVRVTADPDFIRRADRIVLPGQGAFAQCMTGLLAIDGLVPALQETARVNARPFLGICVGMQLLMCDGFEHGVTEGLGWIGGVCTALETTQRLPHMGWNAAAARRPHPILSPHGETAHYYFAHSFVVRPDDPDAVVLESTHGPVFAAAIAHENLLGVQFHPEKSQAAGLALLARFMDWKP